MTITAARRIFREALRRHKRAPFGEKRKTQAALVRARTELMRIENARAGRAAA